MTGGLTVLMRPVATLLDPRWLVCLAAVVLFLAPSGKTGVFTTVDRAVMDAANAIQRPSLDGSAYVRVNVSPAEMLAFLRDPVGSAQMVTLLAAFEQAYTRSVVFVLPEVLPARNKTEDLLASLDTALPADTPLGAQAKLVREAWNTLDHAAANTRYVFAIRQVGAERPRPVLPLANLFGGGYGAGIDPTPVLPASFSLASQYVPVFADDVPAIPLFWKTPDGLKPDAVLALYMRQHGFRKVDLPEPSLIQFDANAVLPVSAQGIIYPRVDVKAMDRAGVMQMSLSTLLQQNIKRAVHDKHLVIGLAQDTAVDHVMTGLLSLNQSFYARLPNQYVYIQAAVLLSIVLLSLAVPFLSWRMNTVLLILAAAGVLLLPLAMLIGQGWWLPAGQWLGFLLVAMPVMMLWSLKSGHFDMERHWFSWPVWQREPAAGDDDVTRPLAELVRPAQAHTKPLMPKKPLFAARRREWVHEKEPAATIMGDDTAALSTTSMEASTVHEVRAPVEPKPVMATLHSLVTGQHRTHRPTVRKIGKYDIRSELGRGSMGVVYLAMDSALHRKVAIKTLQYSQFHPDDLSMMKERFFKEAKTAAGLKHPNIVTIHDMGETRDMAYIVMDFVSGSTLASYISKDNLLDVDTVYWIIAEVADALDYAFASRLIHRDIKPSNILYDPVNQEVKIVDFGIVKQLDSSLHQTGTGVSLGSPVYMSPEQVRGDELDGRSDLFSLGVTFYQLLTGELPFKAENIATLTQLILQCKFTPVDEIRPDLPPSARRITNKAMQKNKDNRYEHGSDMAQAIDQARQREFSR